MFSFLKKLTTYPFPKITLTSSYAKGMVEREIAYLEARIDAIAKLQKEKELHRV
jgi:hypothetical protein